MPSSPPHPIHATLEVQARELTQRYPVGTPCRFWPGHKVGPGRLGRVRSEFFVLARCEIVVMVEGWRGCLGATHVEPVGPMGQLPEIDPSTKE